MTARFGGLPLARVSLLLEILGLMALAFAPSPTVAIIGAALAGAGFAPIFPALGNEAMARIPAQNRGVALGLYSVFLDLALGSTGPIAGLLANRFGYTAPFLLGAGAVLLSFALIMSLRRSGSRYSGSNDKGCRGSPCFSASGETSSDPSARRLPIIFARGGYDLISAIASRREAHGHHAPHYRRRYARDRMAVACVAFYRQQAGRAEDLYSSGAACGRTAGHCAGSFPL
ncbi:MFS transporter [Rhizobium leucaenae]|uniref:MFS transporter n=1 Tax=Rhizobium leucaenae TaxID=29450 RepID=UPI0024752BE5|nr:MFS transporter [Rhizobium leucaenae]